MFGGRTSDDARLLIVTDQCLEARQGSEVTPVSCHPRFHLIQYLDVGSYTPVIHHIVSPAIGLILVALRAGIWATGANRYIGAGNPHAVIAPGIDTHIELIGHVAVNTSRARTSDRVLVMTGLIVSFGLMALSTDTIPLGD